jgi:hypothetical protein
MEPIQIHVRETSGPFKGSFLYSEELLTYQEAATALGKQFYVKIGTASPAVK